MAIRRAKEPKTTETPHPVSKSPKNGARTPGAGNPDFAQAFQAELSWKEKTSKYLIQEIQPLPKE